MRGLADRGKTVLVSSHILSEVQQVADTVTIIGRGQLLAEGTVAEILARGGQARSGSAWPIPRRAAAAAGAEPASRCAPAPDQTLTVGATTAPGGHRSTPDPARITEVLADRACTSAS